MILNNLRTNPDSSTTSIGYEPFTLQERLLTVTTTRPAFDQPLILASSQVPQTSRPSHPTTQKQQGRSDAPTPSQPETAQGTESDDKENIAILIAYAPENANYHKKMLGLINSLKQRLCYKGRKWENLNIIIKSFDITHNLSTITDTARSNDPLQPFQLVLWLLSPEFEEPAFCYNENLAPDIIHQEQYRRLLCILVHLCPLDGYPFDTIQEECYLPDNRIPISSWEGKDAEYQAFYNISKGIEKAIEQIRERL